ncbi:SagB family peptide dehydrogenase [Paenibacillus sp. HJGM_3]|uniref:SagB family peptide dehydrogenase n=1 Tax=Paenibacillus sp. HJGM_3 TaxID=3379816 RepID=UPI00385C30DA
MSLREFLHHLQFEPDKIKPPGWETDWEDAPLPYKLYRRLPTIPLCAEVPLTLYGDEASERVKVTLKDLGHLLWHVYGLTQISQTQYAMDAPTGEGEFEEEEPSFPYQMYRRFIPSGGGLYPNELYVYLKLEGAPHGVYHYDVAHHRLVLLREGVYDSYLDRALGHRSEVSACCAVAFVSAYFWKNFFKYNNFSYRLQGLDAGVLIGQLLEGAKRFGFKEACVHYQFLDQAVNHLLGLSDQEESVYAVIPLSYDAEIYRALDAPTDTITVTASDLMQELSELRHEQYVHSARIVPFPKLLEMNEASRISCTQSFRSIGERTSPTFQFEETEAIELPHVDRMSYDWAAVCRKRYSPEADYILREVSLVQLAGLLREATASWAYRNDLDRESAARSPRVFLYVSLYAVEGVPDGAYRYDAVRHALWQVRPGDHRPWLQKAVALGNISLYQVPLIFHVAGDRNHLIEPLGYRGYRIQQMEAGMLVQRLLLAAGVHGFGGRPLLGFDPGLSDELFRAADADATCLIQIPIGPHRGRERLEGKLSC